VHVGAHAVSDDSINLIDESRPPGRLALGMFRSREFCRVALVTVMLLLLYYRQYGTVLSYLVAGWLK
jgi:hypothetical protein